MTDSKSQSKTAAAMLTAFAVIVAMMEIPVLSGVQSQQDCHPTERNVTTPAPDGYLTAQAPAVCQDNNGNATG